MGGKKDLPHFPGASLFNHRIRKGKKGQLTQDPNSGKEGTFLFQEKGLTIKGKRREGKKSSA